MNCEADWFPIEEFLRPIACFLLLLLPIWLVWITLLGIVWILLLLILAVRTRISAVVLCLRSLWEVLIVVRILKRK